MGSNKFLLPLLVVVLCCEASPSQLDKLVRFAQSSSEDASPKAVNSNKAPADHRRSFKLPAGAVHVASSRGPAVRAKELRPVSLATAVGRSTRKFSVPAAATRVVSKTNLNAIMREFKI